MSNNQHKNKARNQLREAHHPNRFIHEPITVSAKWFANRVKRNRVRDRIAKASRRRNRQ